MQNPSLLAEPTLPSPRASCKEPFILPTKRALDYDPSSSSDPPLFSSDDFPSADGQDGRNQRKRQYRGSWWGPDTPQTRQYKGQRRRFERTMDSGVWLDSDDSDISVNALPSEEEDPPSYALHQAEDGLGPNCASHSDVLDRGRPTIWSSKQSASKGPHETFAERIVQLCLENGNERVDLSDLALTSLPGSTLQPLRYLTKHPKFHDFYPSQEVYSPFFPSLHLFLSRNLLRNVPGEIFQLQSLTVLSLRNNKLSELPPAISKLSNLVELNVGGNKLRWLPWEMLELLGPRAKLRVLNLHPNPFVEPAEASKGESTPTAASGSRVTDALPSIRPEEPAFRLATPITYYNVDGTRNRSSLGTDPSLASGDARLATATKDHVSKAPTTEPVTFVPSLVELSLRACSNVTYLAHLPDLLPPDAPESLHRLLRQAVTARESGGRQCTTCKKDYVIARTEWVEWWGGRLHSGSNETAVEENDDNGRIPLIRRGCSWRCVPEGAQA